jgi:hypothetical protein
MGARFFVLLSILSAGCANDPASGSPDPEEARESILTSNAAMVSAMVDGSSTAPYLTPEWRGVNLNGTPMSAERFEGEERSMQEPSFAEMRLLDVYVLHEDRWLLDLTQVTPVFGTVGNAPEQ